MKNEDSISYTYEPHSPIKMSKLPWVYCKYCGLIYLNNPITNWAIKMGCNNEFHYDYKKMLKTSVDKNKDVI